MLVDLPPPKSYDVELSRVNAGAYGRLPDSGDEDEDDEEAIFAAWDAGERERQRDLERDARARAVVNVMAGSGSGSRDKARDGRRQSQARTSVHDRSVRPDPAYDDLEAIARRTEARARARTSTISKPSAFPASSLFDSPSSSALPSPTLSSESHSKGTFRSNNPFAAPYSHADVEKAALQREREEGRNRGMWEGVGEIERQGRGYGSESAGGKSGKKRWTLMGGQR